MTLEQNWFNVAQTFPEEFRQAISEGVDEVPISEIERLCSSISSLDGICEFFSNNLLDITSVLIRNTTFQENWYGVEYYRRNCWQFRRKIIIEERIAEPFQKVGIVWNENLPTEGRSVHRLYRGVIIMIVVWMLVNPLLRKVYQSLQKMIQTWRRLILYPMKGTVLLPVYWNRKAYRWNYNPSHSTLLSPMPYARGREWNINNT